MKEVFQRYAESVAEATWLGHRLVAYIGGVLDRALPDRGLGSRVHLGPLDGIGIECIGVKPHMEELFPSPEDGPYALLEDVLGAFYGDRGLFEAIVPLTPEEAEAVLRVLVEDAGEPPESVRAYLEKVHFRGRRDGRLE
ncbi:hypothetical protein MN1_490 [Thermus phage MN1]|nr:hypothetical protein MN1_490 [Thermus phage MN1]